MRNTFSPTSMPVSRPVGRSGCAGTSAQEMQAYQPSTPREIVTVLGVPRRGRCQRTAIEPGPAVFTYLRIGERAVPFAALKSGIARGLARLDPAEERLKRSIKPTQHILQDLGIDLSVLRLRLLDCWQLRRLHSDRD